MERDVTGSSTLENISEEITKLRVEPERFFIPSDEQAESQKTLFMGGFNRNPKFTYPELGIEEICARHTSLSNLNSKVKNIELDTANAIAYEDIIGYQLKINDFLLITWLMKNNNFPEAARLRVDEEWMNLNIEL